MDEVVPAILWGLFRLIVTIAFEGLFLRVFYYVGAIPVWLISFGRYPTKDPRDLSRANRVIYAFIGVGVTIALGIAGIQLSEPGALL